MTIRDCWTIAGQGISIGRNLEHSTEAACRQEHALGMKHVELTGGDLERDDSAAFALDHDQVEHVEFVKERHPLLDALLVQGLQDHVPGSVGRMAGSHHRQPRFGGICAGGRGRIVSRIGLGMTAKASL